jgi:alginate O-acetyltransferase complex protein AlgI
MTVLSIEWALLMATTVAVYWLLPGRFRSVFITAATFTLLAALDAISAVLLSALTAVTYFAASRRVHQRALIIGVVVGVASILVYYKLRISNAPMDAIRDVAMPLGLSYYTFRIIHYLIERARGTAPPHGFGDYVSYLFFAPIILVGPIARFPDFLRDKRDNRWSADDLSAGAERLLFGYFKIAVLANFLMSNLAARQIGAIPAELKPLSLYLEAVRGSFVLYFLFSGYSDVAIGFARTLGYRIIENFNWPFLQKNVADFWRSWHISLTSWSREYIFMTVVGFTRNPIFGTLASLTIIGMWHELSIRYVVWGLYHGLGIIAVNQYQKWRRQKMSPAERRASAQAKSFQPVDVLKILATANWFFFGYVIIHSKSLGDALATYHAMLFSWWI